MEIFIKNQPFTLDALPLPKAPVILFYRLLQQAVRQAAQTSFQTRRELAIRNLRAFSRLRPARAVVARVGVEQAKCLQ